MLLAMIVNGQQPDAAAAARDTATVTPAGAPAVPAPPSGAGAPSAGGGFIPDGNMERKAVPDAFKWKFAPLFADDAAFARGLAAQAEARTRLKSFAGRLADPAALRDCLGLYFDARLLTNRLSLYGNLRHVGDTAATDGLALRDRGLAALNDLMADAAFIRREVMAIDDAALAAAGERDPRLAAYRPYLDEMRRRRARVLDAEAERVLALAGDNLWAEIDLNEIPSDHEKSFRGILTGLSLPEIRDENEAPVRLTLSNYGKYRASADRRVRREAVTGLFGTLRAQQHGLAATLAGQMRTDVFLARARGYDTALAAYLDKDNIDTAVYRNLIGAIHDNLGPLHDYVALRREVMLLPDIHLYDLYTPLVPAVAKEYPYETARRLLPESLAPLGADYIATLRTGLDLGNGWIDLYPNRNKESGAFSSSVYRIHPFVKMNYYNGYDDLSTLAHEMGHALHSHLSSAKQPYPTASYATFIAEIASTVNEKLLSDHLVTHATTDDERLFLLNHLLESLRTTIYRQALFAEFELLAHTAAEEGTPITADFLNATYRRLITRYYGPALTIDADDEVEWAYIPHFYYKYYLSAYATGLSSGVALAEGIQSGDPKKRDAYLGMLSAGSSKPPLAILKDAGVDLTKPDAVVAAARLMDRTIKDMRAILARRAPQ
jgi:oligoendopeptidase F